MKEMLIETGLCARSLELDMKMDSFDKRLDVQKRFYLMQIFGVDLGFQYNWYLRGPYCMELTRVAYELLKENINIDEYVFEDEEIVSTIHECNKWITDTKPNEMTRLEWEELLASLHFIKHNAYMNINKTKDSVCAELKKRKDWYTLNHIEYAWKVLDNKQLITSKIREM